MGIMEELKKQARETEREIDQKLEDLEKLNTNIDPECTETEEARPEERLKSSITRLLSQLKKTATEMQEISSSKLDQTMSSQYLSSHESYNKRFIEIRKVIEYKRWQQELMGNQQAEGEMQKVENLLREGRSLDNSLEMGQSVIKTAGEVFKSLAYQKTRLMASQDKLVRFAETIPGINTLLSRISRRKRFNAIVIGLAIAICGCITLLYVAF